MAGRVVQRTRVLFGSSGALSARAVPKPRGRWKRVHVSGMDALGVSAVRHDLFAGINKAAFCSGNCH